MGWIKADEDMPNNPKVIRLHPVGRWAWLGLLCLARRGNPFGTWKASSPDRIAADLFCVLNLQCDGYGIAELGRDLERMEQMRMIAIDRAAGRITILNYPRDQARYPSDDPDYRREKRRISKEPKAHSTNSATSSFADRSEEEVEVEKRRSRAEEQDLHAHRFTRTLPQTRTIAELSARDDGAPVTANGFAKFWEMHPKSRLSQRDDALKAWLEINPSHELADRICKALRYQLRQPHWTDQNFRYVPRPDLYLLDRMFEHVWRDPGPYFAPLGLGIPQCAKCLAEMRFWKRADPGRCPDCLVEIGAVAPATGPVQPSGARTREEKLP
jgi:hypothetical protein